MIKYELIPEQLIYEGTLTDSHLFIPDFLTDTEILLSHTDSYLQRLLNLPLSRREERAIGFPVRDDLVKRGRHIASGTYQCAKYAQIHGISINVAGGTHHAFADHGEGFCVFNDVALAINKLKSEGFDGRILIIDLDVHQGNGTASIFKCDPSVFTFSIHGERNYPLRKEISDLDIGLADSTDDNGYMRMLQKHLPGLIDNFQPDLAFFIAGVDILQQDKLGRLSVSIEGCRIRDHFVLRLCKSHNIPVAVVMGGGYALKISDIVAAHANTFRVAQELYF